MSKKELSRTAKIELDRGNIPVVSAGIRDLRVLKTTQSSFVDFVMDEFASLPEQEDRLFSTVVTADWTYSSSVDYDSAFDKVRSAILSKFAGPADIGVQSPSVQETQYKTEKEILELIPEVYDSYIFILKSSF